MNHHVAPADGLPRGVFVENVADDELYVESVEILLEAGAEIVQHNDVTDSRALRQLPAQIRADESRSARHKYSHANSSRVDSAIRNSLDGYCVFYAFFPTALGF